MRGLLLGLVSVLALGACSHYSEELSSLDKEMGTTTETAMAASPQDIAPAAGIEADGFRKNLAREYYDMARFENDKAYDYKASKSFTNKAMIAAQGKIPAPSKISAYDIPAGRIAELTDARKELINALKTQNTPENAAALARAQCRFECWLERAEEAPDDSHYASCRDEFNQAMVSLTMPAAGDAPPTTYDIAFGANSAIIDPKSANTLDLIVQFLNDPANAAYSASLTGFSSATGEYAGSVLTTRVNAVRDALVAKGVSLDRLKPLVAPAASADEGGKVQVALIAPGLGINNSTTQTFVPVEPKVVSETPSPVAAPAR